MNRRTFLKRGALLGAGMAATVATPAAAHHASEPHEPIIGIGLDVYRYPHGTTKVSKRILISEPGTTPPAGQSTTPIQVQILDQIGPGGVQVGTVQAAGWTTYGSAVTFDTATGLPIIAGNIRTEPFISIGQTARRDGIPSEHWDSRMVVDRVTNLNRDARRQLWGTLVHHANVGPHNSQGGAIQWQSGFHEVEQDNDYPEGERLIPGEVLVISWQLDGWESKRRFTVETRFVWGGPAA